MEFELLKIYIKINMANSVIWPYKYFANTFIFFVKNLDSNL